MNLLKKIGIGIISVFVLIIVLALIFGESETQTTNPSTNNEPEETRTESKVAKSEDEKQKSKNEQFTVERDEVYLSTREKIWEFLLDKGYEVETTMGVPNIGKTDAKLDEGYEGWYAFIEQNGEWTEFNIVLFNGDVAGIQPAQR